MQGGGKIVYKNLSYEIVGVMFEVYNELGYGHLEKVYCRAAEAGFREKGLAYRKQVYYQVKYKGEIVGRNYLDFLVEEKVIIEMKRGNYYSKKNIEQIKSYLKVTNLKLAILVNFTSTGVKFYRLLNI